MPIFEFKCQDCDIVFEEITTNAQKINCVKCGSSNVEKLISSTSSLSGKDNLSVPDAKGTGCCGSNPNSKGCVPGSCCGKA